MEAPCAERNISDTNMQILSDPTDRGNLSLTHGDREQNGGCQGPGNRGKRQMLAPVIR